MTESRIEFSPSPLVSSISWYTASALIRSSSAFAAAALAISSVDVVRQILRERTVDLGKSGRDNKGFYGLSGLLPDVYVVRKNDKWTVELAFPWAVLREYNTRHKAPKAGEQWRRSSAGTASPT